MLLALADATGSHMARQALASGGHTVGEARDAQGLRAALRAEILPDAILLEDSLPGADSLELLAEIKRTHPLISVVLAVARPSPASLLQALHAGAVDMLPYPLDAQELLTAVARALERKRVMQGWLKRETGRITGPLSRRISEMESILGQVDDGILVLDKQYCIVTINQALRSNFGLEGAELTGRSVDKVFDHPALLDALRSEDSGERQEIQSPQGRVFHMRVSRIPEVGTVASFHDISYLKELDKLKGDFVNTVSHDLRSPLTAILGYVELIERAGKVNPQQLEFIHRVKSSVHATTDMIDDLLKLGRVEVGALDEQAPVDMRLLVANVMSDLQPKIQERNQTLRMRKGRSLPLVMGSRSQLNQLVDNLLGNAVKYTQEGGKVYVTLEVEQHQLILRVADNGPGIPLEEQARIFEKFYRASNVGEMTPGTGLGLAIVKTIVENHRGRIWVDSKPGEGAMFTVVLPVHEPERKAMPARERTAPQKAARPKAK